MKKIFPLFLVVIMSLIPVESIATTQLAGLEKPVSGKPLPWKRGKQAIVKGKYGNDD